MQGFLFRPDDSGEVSGSHAHAWVEAYMSGVGWVTFEPTASEANAEDRAWNKQPAGEKQPEEELFPEEPEITPPDLPVGELPAVSVRTDHSRGMKSMLRTIIGYVLIGILGLFMAILLFLFAGRLRYKHLPPEETAPLFSFTLSEPAGLWLSARDGKMELLPFIENTPPVEVPPAPASEAEARALLQQLATILEP